ncbi:MAG: hypothetical protein KAY65_09310 [Planctomycetes bacterium]|nr:hypothetical protein [Planctomycetota bacterium]
MMNQKKTLIGLTMVLAGLWTVHTTSRPAFGASGTVTLESLLEEMVYRKARCAGKAE